MSSFFPPAGYSLLRLPTGPAWLRPSFKKPILQIWQNLDPHLPLRRAGRLHPQVRSFTGRAPVLALPLSPRQSIAVRPCVHGGLWGKIAHDIYLTPRRVTREVLRSRLCSSLGIPTPEILAILFYPAGPAWKIDVVTSLVPHSRDLISFLSTRPNTSARARAFTAVRLLMKNCARHGLRHPDMNARNILLAGPIQGPFCAWLLDVDSIALDNKNSPTTDTSNRNRLLRSLIKRARLGDLGWTEKEVPQLWRELFPKK